MKLSTTLQDCTFNALRAVRAFLDSDIRGYRVQPCVYCGDDIKAVTRADAHGSNAFWTVYVVIANHAAGNLYEPHALCDCITEDEANWIGRLLSDADDVPFTAEP